MSSHAIGRACALNILINRIDYFASGIASSYEAAIQSLVMGLRDGIEQCEKLVGNRYRLELDVTNTFALFLVDKHDGGRLASCYIDTASPPILRCTFGVDRVENQEQVFVLDFDRLRTFPGDSGGVSVKGAGVETWHKKHLGGDVVENLGDFVLGELISCGVEILRGRLDAFLSADAALKELL